MWCGDEGEMSVVWWLRLDDKDEEMAVRNRDVCFLR